MSLASLGSCVVLAASGLPGNFGVSVLWLQNACLAHTCYLLQPQAAAARDNVVCVDARRPSMAPDLLIHCTLPYTTEFGEF